MNQFLSVFLGCFLSAEQLGTGAGSAQCRDGSSAFGAPDANPSRWQQEITRRPLAQLVCCRDAVIVPVRYPGHTRWLWQHSVKGAGSKWNSHFWMGVCRWAHLHIHCLLYNPCTPGSITNRHFKAWQSGWEKHLAARLKSALDHMDRELEKFPHNCTQCHEVHSCAAPGSSLPGKLGHKVWFCCWAQQGETTMAELSTQTTQTHPLRYTKAIFNFNYFSNLITQAILLLSGQNFQECNQMEQNQPKMNSKVTSMPQITALQAGIMNCSSWGFATYSISHLCCRGQPGSRGVRQGSWEH